MTPSLSSKPSISTRSWFRVCSRSSWPPPKPAPRWRPTASISSIKMMQGDCFLACSNMSRTRDAPTPTNISTKSEPEIEKNGTLASPAIALASKVLPVPGWPTMSTPRGILPPSFWKRLGSRKNSTNSCTSSLASSTPATSAKVVVIWSSPSSLALLLPKLIGPPRPPAPPCICRMKNMNTAIMSRIGKLAINSCVHTDCCSGCLPSTVTLCARRSSISLGSSTIGRMVSKLLPSLRWAVMVRPSTSTLDSRSVWTSRINSE